MLKRTPLFPVYARYGAKMVEFGGWEMPVQFSSIKEEHEAVRTRAGLFDVSHMGEITVRGRGSLAFLQKLMTNDVAKLRPGRAQYTLMCDENGGTVDDLLIYQKGEDDYLLVVNAANTEKDFAWLSEHADDGVRLEDVSAETAQLALQGPAAERVLQKLTNVDLSALRPFSFQDDVEAAGVKALVSRTGYTGEDGFELYCQAEDAITLWEAILTAGAEDGVLPCGLGARDTLRFEACLPLYGQELSATISPLEAGLGFAVKTEKETPFIGQAMLKRQKEAGPPRRLVGIEMIDKGIPRHGYRVFAAGEEAGFVTTGTQSPTLKKNIGLALVKAEAAAIGQEVEVDIRGKRLKATIVPTPFYKRAKS
ncbi:glycine cleavage system protein T [Geobacillus sp. 46C-IIa]|uniref:glycine cleavage system aminomethyltransferase GcvT n=1 Tax=Geobacillus sp. 46C-IIa TaxID=1963025 RepID=UPI0009BEF0A1|nr:glycine cleavage system aminomethyltransferase GcvT [Geobacillus sp. 46C-IIa]OQP05777.1 glycine cleavage system protein T [Geobacillus sp. 46C-IIa]QNU28867.1 glycine cleavage system aminomethyltransferase GcvT [Geobacillus sp. 46C-IIa]